MIYTEEELKKEIAFSRCRKALQEIDVPGYVIESFKPGRLMDYFVHLCIMEAQPWPWTKALAWIHTNKQSILDQERNERIAASRPSNRASNHGDDAV